MRPPSTSPAPTWAALYMRLYRAYRTGRGPHPGSRSEFFARHLASVTAAEAWQAERDALAAEAEAGRARADAERSWSELRARVLENGGIAPNRDYGARSMPPSVVRRGDSAKPADLMAALLGFESDADLMAALDAAWTNAQRARELAS